MALRLLLGAVSAASARWRPLSPLCRINASCWQYAAVARALSTWRPRRQSQPQPHEKPSSPEDAGSRPPLSSSSVERFFGGVRRVPIGFVAFSLGACFVLYGWTDPLDMALRPGPDSDTPEDAQMTASVREQAPVHVPLVKELSEDAAWTSWEAYEGLTDSAARQRHLMTGPLRGLRGVGAYHRVFVHKTTGEVVTVVFFGNATSGWPGVVHGGMLASVLDECCGRAAFRAWGGLTGVTANLEVQYKLPSHTQRYYVVRARVRDEDELPVEERGKRHYKVYVDAIIQDPKSGRTNVLASAVFVGGTGRDGKGGKLFGETEQLKGLSEGF